MIIIRLLLFFALAAAACSGKKERIIREKVDERVMEFRKRKSAECRESLLVEAEKIVDSLLLHEALQGVSDSLKKTQTFKPFPPVAIPPIDSAVVKPIFD